MDAPHLTDRKILHIRRVAELMYERALEKTGDTAYAEDMYMLGLLHDIGYIYGADEHGASGSALSERNGYRYASEIRYHGKEAVPDEAMTDELMLLQWCDMSVMPGGIQVSCRERLEDIEKRYGRDSKQYRNSEAIIARLAANGLY